jgi:hypothetical protein
MPLPRAVPVTLTAAERTTLNKRARGATTAYRDRLRSQIVLATACAGENARIATDLRITVDRVRSWLHISVYEPGPASHRQSLQAVDPTQITGKTLSNTLPGQPGNVTPPC